MQPVSNGGRPARGDHGAENVAVDGGIGSWGYPGCGLPESPAWCTNSTLYGDVNACDFGGIWSFEDARHWFPLEGSMSCDGGRGMSGSGVFRMSWGTPVVIGQYNQLWCLATDCVGNHYPNVAGLISPNYGAAIDYFKANNP
jgi:hypothetical protein